MHWYIRRQLYITLEPLPFSRGSNPFYLFFYRQMTNCQHVNFTHSSLNRGIFMGCSIHGENTKDRVQGHSTSRSFWRECSQNIRGARNNDEWGFPICRETVFIISLLKEYGRINNCPELNKFYSIIKWIKSD